MFDVDTLVASCRDALTEADPRRAVRDALQRTIERPARVADVLGRNQGGLEPLYHAPDLTVLNVVWAPHMTLPPHDHRMWAVIGIYGGVENNTLYRRSVTHIAPAGFRELRERDVFALGADAIHSVNNPRRVFTGAIHVYGGDFFAAARSQWDPDTLLEQPYDIAYIRLLFEQANELWRQQAGSDIDESTIG